MAHRLNGLALVHAKTIQIIIVQLHGYGLFSALSTLCFSLTITLLCKLFFVPLLNYIFHVIN